MSSEFISKDCVYVSSAERSGGNTNNFTINLEQQIRYPNDYDSICLLTFGCPKSYYLINSTNNTFTLTEGISSYSITIPVGNYSFTSMRSILSTLLNTGHSYVYAVSKSETNGKFTFTCTRPNPLTDPQPSFAFTESSPYLIIGFEPTTYPFSADSLTSENVVNFQLTNTILLCSDIVQTGTLAVIIPNAPDFSYITFQENNPQFASRMLVRKSVQDARFYLLDGNTKKELDLNGLDVDFSFVVFKKNDFYKHADDDKRLEVYAKDLEEQIKEINAEKEKLAKKNA